MRLARVLLLASVGLLSTQLALGAVDFYPKVDYPTGNSPLSVYIARLDTVKGPELILVNSADNNLSVLKNNGDGTFAARVNYPTGNDPQQVYAALLNADQYLDLVVANNGNNSVSVLLNNGSGVFGSKVDYSTGEEPRSVFAIDLDGDGDKDLAVADLFDNKVSTLKNNGNGTFAADVQYATGNGPIWIVAALLDGDTLPDLVTANRAGNSVSVLLNAGDGSFPAYLEYAVGGDPRSVFAADLDRDGDQDLAVANYDSNTVSVLKNNGNGTFAPKVDYPVGISPRSVFAADIDKDLYLELIVTNELSDGVSVLKNNGDGTFAAKEDYQTGANPVAVFARDLDADNDSDLVIVNNADADLSVLENRRCHTFVSGGIFLVGTDVDAAPPDFFVGQLGSDSSPDIVVVDASGNKLVFHQNTGNGSFSEVASQAVAGNPIRCYGGYFDSDGDIDLAVIDNQTPQVIILENTGGFFSFAVVQFLPLDAGSNPQDLRAVDLFAGGGLADLVVLNQDSNSVSIFKSNGTSHPSFSLIGKYQVGTQPIAVTMADIDKDGDQDLITANQTGTAGDSVTVLRNKGNGVFADTARADFLIGLSGTASLFATDFNGDLYPDLAVTWIDSSNAVEDSVSILTNNGDGSFGPPVRYPVIGNPSPHPRGLLAANLVGEDSYPDLLAAAELNPIASNLSILKNKGDGTFLPQFEGYIFEDYIISDTAHVVWASDLDGDADNDLVVQFRYLSFFMFKVLLNQPPCPPLSDTCIAMPGDANASNDYSLGDAISIVNYIFNKPGCSPTPLCWLSSLLCRGDWDGSTTVSLGDVIRAVNYIFNKPGGPWNALPVGVCCL